MATDHPSVGERRANLLNTTVVSRHSNLRYNNALDCTIASVIPTLGTYKLTIFSVLQYIARLIKSLVKLSLYGEIMPPKRTAFTVYEKRALRTMVAAHTAAGS